MSTPIVANLREGLSKDEIGSRLTVAEGIEVHPDLIDWYRWHDGTTTSQTPKQVNVLPGEQLVSHWYLLSLDQAVALHNDRLLAAGRFGLTRFHPDGWFPLLQLQDFGAWLCIDTVGTGELFVVDPDADIPAEPPHAQSRSICEFFETYVRLMRSGVVSCSEDGFEVHRDRLPDDLPGRIEYW